MQQNNRYVSARYLAGRYGVAISTIWKMARDGRLPPKHHLTPRTTRWWLPEVIALESGCRGANDFAGEN